VNLYRRYLDVVSTNDEPIPDANFKAEYVGMKLSDNVTGLQYEEAGQTTAANQAQTQGLLRRAPAFYQLTPSAHGVFL
jgi:hypothetical protein